MLKDEFAKCVVFVIMHDMTCVDCKRKDLTLPFAIGCVLSLSLKFLTGMQTF